MNTRFLFSIIFSTAILLSIPLILSATIFEVGPTKSYISPYALYLADVVNHNDTIQIDHADYIGQASLAVWQKDNLFIKGVGGKPHLIADGENIWGKGIWVCAGNNITVENIEFSGATVPDENGAGIRLDGVGLTVKQCYFHNNENGILTSNPGDGDILIEYTEFSSNGFGDGFTHNLYIGRVNKLTFRYNYSHHAKIGHNLKSRAKENYISYNRIMDEDSGTSSRLIDLSNAGFAIIMGNLLMQGPNAENNNLIGFGLEGLEYVDNQLYIVNNTLVNKRAASCVFMHVQTGVPIFEYSNNIFAGSGTILNGTASNSSSNLIEQTIDNVKLADEANYNYNILSDSPAIDQGTPRGVVNGISLTPSFSYAHPLLQITRNLVNTIDIGAYENGDVISSSDIILEDLGITLYPNPTTGLFQIKGMTSLFEIDVLDINGLVHSNYNSSSDIIIDLSSLPNGLYFVRIRKVGNSTLSFQKIIKSD